MNRKKFLQTSGLLIAGGMVAKAEAAERYLTGRIAQGKEIRAPRDIPMIDLHVHRSDEQTIEDIVAKSKETGIQFGVMENIAPWDIRNDDELKAYIDAVRPYPVYVGLQPMSPGWSKNLSPELIAQADYVSMDPQVVLDGNGYGEQINVWEYASYIDGPELSWRETCSTTWQFSRETNRSTFLLVRCFFRFPSSVNIMRYGPRNGCSKLLMLPGPEI